MLIYKLKKVDKIMTNVINMFKNVSALNTYRNYGDADFTVDKAPLTYITNEGEVLRSRKEVIYRTDTGVELGVHGARYSNTEELSYRKMIDNQRLCIERSGLDINGLEETIRVSHYGAKCFVRHSLPAVGFMTPDGDRATLSFLSVSSLDGSWPFIMSVGAKQNACMNGQIFVSKAAMLYKSRHTKNLDIDKGARVIHEATKVFEMEVDLWFQWAKETKTNMEAFLSFAKAAQAKFVFSYLKEFPNASIGELLLQPHIYNNSALIYMWDKWSTHYSKVLGNNKWGLYNTMTDWSTHAPSSTSKTVDNIASISYKRAEQVKDTMITMEKLRNV